MNEVIKDKIILESVNPIDVYGADNKNITLIKTFFPNLHITARGTDIFLKGDTSDVISFKKLLESCVIYFDKYKTLDERDIERLHLEGFNKDELFTDFSLIGKNGHVIKPKTINQRRMIKLSMDNNLLFVLGLAGTGKTYISVALAVKALKEKHIKKIILTRPAVEAGENLGFLPGDLDDKLSPYMRPLYDSLHDMLSKEKLNYFLENNYIEIVPLAFMRGRTLDNAFVILDEAQNTTINQMKMFLTRMGPNSRFLICGDPSQIDLPLSQNSGLVHAVSILNSLPGIGIIKFDEKDIIRHKLVKTIIKAYKK